jgi:Ca-activated chloride channel family protein
MMALPNIQFATPAALLLLAALPVWWLWRRRRHRPAIVFSRTATLASGPRSGRTIARVVFVSRNLLLIGAIVALARPRSGARAENITTEGINIVIAIDLSSSMLAQDFQPNNRLEVAKEKMRRFVASRTSDRIGTAIAVAANRLRNAPGRSRVMIVLTDGENNRGAIDPRTAAKAAAAFNIKIYTIGVGTEGMAPIPVSQGAYGMRFENRPVRIDEPLLTDVATITGGKYFRARDAEALEAIYANINALEREPVRTRTFVRFTELFLWPLSLAIAALLVELSLVAWRGPLP